MTDARNQDSRRCLNLKIHIWWPPEPVAAIVIVRELPALLESLVVMFKI